MFVWCEDILLTYRQKKECVCLKPTINHWYHFSFQWYRSGHLRKMASTTIRWSQWCSPAFGQTRQPKSLGTSGCAHYQIGGRPHGDQGRRQLQHGQRASCRRISQTLQKMLPCTSQADIRLETIPLSTWSQWGKTVPKIFHFDLSKQKWQRFELTQGSNYSRF